jgi:protein arginine kinase
MIKCPGAWLEAGSATAIVISSRVRLARNLSGFVFPATASESERVRLRDRLRPVLSRIPSLKHRVLLNMDDIGPVEREVLKERHLISNDLVEHAQGSAVVIADDERVAVMVNEEDHLRIQTLAPGLRLSELWERLNAIDNEIEQQVEYAFSRKLGYLTACPTNLGTGCRASVMLHLPALRLTEDVDSVIKGLNAIAFEVRGVLGEGTPAFGNMFQLSNRITLGVSEQEILAGLDRMVQEVVRHEINARGRLLEEDPLRLLDLVSRSYAMVEFARLLSSTEALDLLSGLRFGRETGLLRNVSEDQINQALLLTQPGHMQKTAGRKIESHERDELRAGILRDLLKGMRLRTDFPGRIRS